MPVAAIAVAAVLIFSIAFMAVVRASEAEDRRRIDDYARRLQRRSRALAERYRAVN